MSYLLTAQQITDALGAAGCARPGDQPINQYITALGMVQSRVEGLMNVQTLELGTFTDTFTVIDCRQRKQLLRLTNALLPADTPCTVASADGSDIGAIKVDRRYGIVTTAQLSEGDYTCTYTAGLDKDADGFFKDVPQWLTSIAINCIVIWFRLGMLSPKVPDSVSYAALIQATVRELSTRIYETYMRPRVDVLWPEQLSDGS